MGFFSALAFKRKPKPAPVSSASTISLPRKTSFAQPDRRTSNDDEARSLAPQPMQKAYVPAHHQLASEPPARKSIRDVLHLLVLIVSAIGIGFSWSLLAPGTSRYFSGLVLLPIGAGSLFATAFLWSFAELVVRCMRRWKTGLPSAAHICVCLCIFASSVGLSILIFFQLYWNRCNDKKDDDDDDDDDRFAQFISNWRCTRARPPLYLGVAILLALMALLETAIFINACIDTRRHRNAVRQRRETGATATSSWCSPPQGLISSQTRQNSQREMAHLPQTPKNRALVIEEDTQFGARSPTSASDATKVKELAGKAGPGGWREFYAPAIKKNNGAGSAA